LQSKETTYQEPTLSDNPTEVEKLKWSKDYDLYMRKTHAYETHKAKVFAYILSECDDAMKNRLETMTGYDEVDEGNQVVELLALIKRAMYDTNDKKYPPMQAVEAWQQLLRVQQFENDAVIAYYKRFQSLLERVELCYGPLKPEKLAEKEYKSNASQTRKEAILEEQREKMLACIFMRGTNKLLKTVLKDLENDFALGQAKYPATVEEALQVMTLYEDRLKPKFKKGYTAVAEGMNPELSFAQMKEMKKNGQCFKCGKQGHIAVNCPGLGEPTREEAQLMQRQVGWMGVQRDGTDQNPQWIG